MYPIFLISILYLFMYWDYSMMWHDMGTDQYLLIPFLGGWTSIYQLFWGSPGVQGFDSYPYNYIPFKSLWSPHSSYHRFSMVEIPLCEARVYERFVNKTLRELNGMAGIFRRFTRAKSREAGRIPGGDTGFWVSACGWWLSLDMIIIICIYIYILYQWIYI